MRRLFLLGTTADNKRLVLARSRAAKFGSFSVPITKRMLQLFRELLDEAEGRAPGELAAAAAPSVEPSPTPRRAASARAAAADPSRRAASAPRFRPDTRPTPASSASAPADETLLPLPGGPRAVEVSDQTFQELTGLAGPAEQARTAPRPASRPQPVAPAPEPAPVPLAEAPKAGVPGRRGKRPLEVPLTDPIPAPEVRGDRTVRRAAAAAPAEPPPTARDRAGRPAPSLAPTAAKPSASEPGAAPAISAPAPPVVQPPPTPAPAPVQASAVGAAQAGTPSKAPAPATAPPQAAVPPALEPEPEPVVEPSPPPRLTKPFTSRLTPAQMQTLFRQGKTVKTIAERAGAPLEWVRRLTEPIASEKMGAVDEAKRAWYAKPRLGRSALPVGRAIAENLEDRGVQFPADAVQRGWTAYRPGSRAWRIRFTYEHRGSRRTAQWDYDPSTRTITPRNALAAQLGWRAPAAPEPVAEVIPLSSLPPARATKPRRRKVVKRPAAAAPRRRAVPGARRAAKRSATRTTSRSRTAKPSASRGSKGKPRR